MNSHPPEHQQRTIVCNPVEALSMQEAVDRMVADPEFTGVAPTVTSNSEVKEGRAYSACFSCLAPRPNNGGN